MGDESLLSKQEQLNAWFNKVKSDYGMEDSPLL